ncbi:MAG: N-6 DNA methylase [Ignavibacteriales bacterium]|nr:N-6 DNA methylase [Ignavibacteriales bacterium]
MTAPKEIVRLVERFDQNREQYTSGNYNEAQLRQEFLNPFFSALGWDVENRQGYAEPYKEVIHEDAIKIGAATKAPDYAFRIGGTRKFFVEAKNPSVNLKEDFSPSYQLRRYAWSAKLPLSILTDFQEFAVYDCRTQPFKTDKASTGRVRYLTYNDYATEWESIATVFSKEAVLRGAYDKFAESTKGKKGTAEVDDAFLKEIESWRDILAKNIALRNPKLSQPQLNFAVQRTIDRIIFLRICEDRGIEQYGRLLALVNGERVYRRLYEQFEHADEKYNSGLFHFEPEKGRPEQPDELSLLLHIDDKPLKEIIGNLYYPDCPYEFSVLPADILGQVYEQFLGKVIRLTAGHQAKVEEKPEVKKAGGVYYTPTYIVDYIVKNTVGKLLNPETSETGSDKSKRHPERSPDVLSRDGVEGSAHKPTKPFTPKEAAKLRILDPACGSGSFLIGAYQYLLDWHRDWYFNDGPEKHASGRNATVFRGPGGEWRLTTAERKRILLNNIYGVDIDSQAVEVTKLSLLLKVLEGENEQTISQQLKMFHQRALPDLGSNIKCGNSLIGPDFYDGKQLSLLDEQEKNRINVFDWKKEFMEIMDAGGFDAVIGNPPYVRQEGLSFAKDYFEAHFKTFRSTADLYVGFVEMGLRLLRPLGHFGMIISNKWLRADYGDRLRDFLQKEASLSCIIDLSGLPVFEGATVRTIILICSRSKVKRLEFQYLPPMSIEDFRTIRSGGELERMACNRSHMISVQSLSSTGWSLSRSSSTRLVQKLVDGKTLLGEYIKRGPFFGIKTGFNEAFIIDQEARNKLVEKDRRCADIIKPLVGGRDVQRYHLDFDHKYLIWTYIGVPINKYPSILKHLTKFEDRLKKRSDQGNEWWELRACDYYEDFQKPKIIYPDISTSCRFTLDLDGFFGSNTSYVIPSDNLYLLALLNSRVANFYFHEVCAGLESKGTTYLRFFGQYLSGFPVCQIDSTIASDKSRHDKMVQLVEQMLSLHKQLPAAKTEQEKTVIQRQIDATDKQIDQLVYELYGLTEEEIRIVEGIE